MHTFTLEYWQDGGWYVGRLRENPSVMTQGETLADLQDNIRDAYELMMDTEPPPTTASVHTVEITV
jgi:predicted RNase H-like HicB family nuclease